MERRNLDKLAVGLVQTVHQDRRIGKEHGKVFMNGFKFLLGQCPALLSEQPLPVL